MYPETLSNPPHRSDSLVTLITLLTCQEFLPQKANKMKIRNCPAADFNRLWGIGLRGGPFSILIKRDVSPGSGGKKKEKPDET